MVEYLQCNWIRNRMWSSKGSLGKPKRRNQSVMGRGEGTLRELTCEAYLPHILCILRPECPNGAKDKVNARVQQPKAVSILIGRKAPCRSHSELRETTQSTKRTRDRTFERTLKERMRTVDCGLRSALCC